MDIPHIGTYPTTLGIMNAMLICILLGLATYTSLVSAKSKDVKNGTGNFKLTVELPQWQLKKLLKQVSQVYSSQLKKLQKSVGEIKDRLNIGMVKRRTMRNTSPCDPDVAGKLGFVKINGSSSCYKFIFGLKKRSALGVSDRERECNRLNSHSHLARLGSRGEFQAVQSFAKDHFGSLKAIVVNDTRHQRLSVASSCASSDGDTTEGNCMALVNSCGWNFQAIECSPHHPFLCEIER